MYPTKCINALHIVVTIDAMIDDDAISGVHIELWSSQKDVVECLHHS